MVESVLNKIPRRDSRLAIILKRSFHQGGFPVNIVNTLELPALLSSPCTGEVDGGHKKVEDTVTFPSKGIL